MRHFLTLLAAFLLWVPSYAHAEAEHKDSPEYAKAVSLGLAEFEDKNFPEARAQFARAHALSPSARTLRALGMVEFELKHYAESARLLSDALSSRTRPLDGEKQAHAQQLLDRADSYIGRITFDLEPQTQLIVDGVPTELEAGRQLVLEVGDHALEFQAPARIAQKRNMTVQGGEHKTLKVRLMELSTRVDHADASPSSTPSAPKERRALKSPWLWTAVGVLVAGAAAGTAIGLTRKAPGTRTEPAETGTGGAPALGTP